MDFLCPILPREQPAVTVAFGLGVEPVLHNAPWIFHHITKI